MASSSGDPASGTEMANWRPGMQRTAVLGFLDSASSAAASAPSPAALKNIVEPGRARAILSSCSTRDIAAGNSTSWAGKLAPTLLVHSSRTMVLRAPLTVTVSTLAPW